MKRKGSKIGSYVMAVMMALVVLFPATASMGAESQAEAQGIVDNAGVTFGNFMRDKDFGWIHENIKKAKGILIYPQVLKAGFILGGSGGTGVLLVHDTKTGNWSQPAFYTMGSVSFGLQIGGEAAQTVILAMSQKAVDALYTSSVKLGGDTSIAVGPVGAGAKSDVMVDFIAFSKSKGAYAGLNLEGSVVEVRDSLNKAYYGKDVRPVEIIVEKKVSNKGSAQLRADLKRHRNKNINILK